MPVEENKAAFRHYVEEVWIEEDLDFVDEIFAGSTSPTSPTAQSWSAVRRTSRSSSGSTAPPSPTSRT